jgi:hypothetical protein
MGRQFGVWEEREEGRDRRRQFPVRGNGGGDGADRWGPCVRERRENRGGTGSVNLNGPRTGFCSGPKGLPRPLFIFFCSAISSFLFSVFLNSSITFAFVTQTTSNQLQMFSKIQGIKVGQ